MTKGSDLERVGQQDPGVSIVLMQTNRLGRELSTCSSAANGSRGDQSEDRYL